MRPMDIAKTLGITDSLSSGGTHTSHWVFE
jgi:hypothetical protein